MRTVIKGFFKGILKQCFALLFGLMAAIPAHAQVTAGNQIVPHNVIVANVSSGRFAAKTGITIPNDTKCVTTAEVKTLIWLQESYLPANALQLPTWQQLVPYYSNVIQVQSFQKTCGSGSTGSFVADTIAAGLYVDSTQALANSKAYAALLTDGPVNANNKGTCTVNCTGAAYKVINGICTEGVKTYDGSTGSGTQWVCNYYYRWGDGTRSPDYQENSTHPCQAGIGD